MPAPAKNQNAAKPPEERLDSTLKIRCTAREHAAWAGASALAGAASLSAWVVDLLNRKAGREKRRSVRRGVNRETRHA